MRLIEKLRAKFKSQPAQLPAPENPRKRMTPDPKREEEAGIAAARNGGDRMLADLLAELPKAKRNDFGELGKLIATKGLSGNSRLWSAIARKGYTALRAARDTCFGVDHANHAGEGAAYNARITVTEAAHRRDHIEHAPAPAPTAATVVAPTAPTITSEPSSGEEKPSHDESDDEERDYLRSEFDDVNMVAESSDPSSAPAKESDVRVYSGEADTKSGVAEPSVTTDDVRENSGDATADVLPAPAPIAAEPAPYSKTGADVREGRAPDVAPAGPVIAPSASVASPIPTKPKLPKIHDKATPGVRPGDGEYERIPGQKSWSHTGTATLSTPRTEVIGKRGNNPDQPDAADPYVHEDKLAAFSGRSYHKDAVVKNGGVDKTAYLGPRERADYAASPGKDAEGNVVLVGADGKPLDTAEGSTTLRGAAQGRFIFVLSKTGNLYLANATKESTDRTAKNRAEGSLDEIFFHHTSLLAGGDVLAAGDLEIRSGKVIAISNDSGHYKMGIESNVQMLDALAKLGFDVAALRVETKLSRTVMVPATGDAVLNSGGNLTQLKHHDNAMNDIRVPGFAQGKAGKLLAKQRAAIEQQEQQQAQQPAPAARPAIDLGANGRELFDEMTELLGYATRLGVAIDARDAATTHLQELGTSLLRYQDAEDRSDGTVSLAMTMCTCRRAYDALCAAVDDKLAEIDPMPEPQGAAPSSEIT